MGRRPNPETIKTRHAVVKAWNKGTWTGPEVAAQLGISLATTTLHLWKARQEGWDVRKGTNARPETERLRDQAVRAFNKGNTQAEVGAMLGITRHAVGRLIAEARAMGVSTVHYSTVETSLRSLASRRSRQAQTATDN